MLKNIVDRCKEQGISIAELERKANLAERTIYKWDVSVPSVKKVMAVAKVLGCTVDDLMAEE